MGNARYIGRVGALAVALGIGAAAVSTPTIAFAEESADSSSAAESSAAEASPTQADPVDDANSQASVDASGGSEADSDDIDEDEVPDVSGDVDQDVDQDDDEDTADDETDGDAVSTSDSDGDASAAARFAATDNTEAAESDDEMAVAAEESDETAVESGPVASAAPPAGPAPALTSVSTAATFSAAAPAAAVVDAPMPVAEPARTGLVGVVSALASWLGLGPSLSTDAPATPAAQPFLWGLLAWARREIQRTFFNQTPTIDYNPVNTSHVVDGRVVTALIGDLGAVDADGDPLRFSVTQDPQKGSVEVNADGTFTYTPSREFAAVGGTDVFVVKAGDVGLHLHGFDALFKRDFGRTTETAIEVVVDAQCPAGCQVNPVKVIDTIEVGNGPDGVAFSQDGSRAYVTNALDDTVSVIHVATGTVVGAIAVGDHPRDVVFNPQANRAYVTNLLDGTVSVVNTLNNTVIATIPVGVSAERVAVSPGGTRVYVIGSQEYGSAMITIDATTNTVLSKAALNGTGYGIAVHPGGVRVFVATQIDWLDVVEILNNNVTHFDTNDGWMRDIGFSPQGTRVYTSNGEAGTVSVRNANTYALIDTINVGAGAQGLAVSPDGTRLYVVNQDDGTVSVISTATNNVIKTVDVGFLPHWIAISPDGTLAYVTNGGSDSVSVLTLV